MGRGDEAQKGKMGCTNSKATSQRTSVAGDLYEDNNAVNHESASQVNSQQQEVQEQQHDPLSEVSEPSRDTPTSASQTEKEPLSQHPAQQLQQAHVDAAERAVQQHPHDDDASSPQQHYVPVPLENKRMCPCCHQTTCEAYEKVNTAGCNSASDVLLSTARSSCLQEAAGATTSGAVQLSPVAGTTQEKPRTNNFSSSIKQDRSQSQSQSRGSSEPIFVVIPVVKTNSQLKKSRAQQKEEELRSKLYMEAAQEHQSLKSKRHSQPPLHPQLNHHHLEEQQATVLIIKRHPSISISTCSTTVFLASAAAQPVARCTTRSPTTSTSSRTTEVQPPFSFASPAAAAAAGPTTVPSPALAVPNASHAANSPARVQSQPPERPSLPPSGRRVSRVFIENPFLSGKRKPSIVSCVAESSSTVPEGTPVRVVAAAAAASTSRFSAQASVVKSMPSSVAASASVPRVRTSLRVHEVEVFGAETIEKSNASEHSTVTQGTPFDEEPEMSTPNVSKEGETAIILAGDTNGWQVTNRPSPSPSKEVMRQVQMVAQLRNTTPI